MLGKDTPQSPTHSGEVPGSDEDFYGGSTDEAGLSDSEGTEICTPAVWHCLFLLVHVDECVRIVGC